MDERFQAAEKANRERFEMAERANRERFEAMDKRSRKSGANTSMDHGQVASEAAEIANRERFDGPAVKANRDHFKAMDKRWSEPLDGKDRAVVGAARRDGPAGWTGRFELLDPPGKRRQGTSRQPAEGG